MPNSDVKATNMNRFKGATISRVADQFLSAFEPGERTEEHKSPGDDGWVNGKIEPIQYTEGEGSQVPFARDNQGNPLPPPDLGIETIPGYEWHDKSKAFHSIESKTASDKTASLLIELKWAADAIDRANELLHDVANTLDAREHGQEAISDVVGAAAKVSQALRRTISRDLADAADSLRKAL